MAQTHSTSASEGHGDVRKLVSAVIDLGDPWVALSLLRGPGKRLVFFEHGETAEKELISFMAQSKDASLAKEVYRYFKSDLTKEQLSKVRTLADPNYAE